MPVVSSLGGTKKVTLVLEKEWKALAFCMSSCLQKCCNGTSAYISVPKVIILQAAEFSGL